MTFFSVDLIVLTMYLLSCVKKKKLLLLPPMFEDCPPEVKRFDLKIWYMLSSGYNDSLISLCEMPYTCLIRRKRDGLYTSI